MSTASVVAVQNGNGWKGRYVHWNGYPTWQAAQLLALLKRDGYEKVAKTIVTGRTYGWSVIDPSKTEPDPLLGDRAKLVKGYGIAYTAKQDITAKDWVTSENVGEWIGISWVYVLLKDAVLVARRRDPSRGWVVHSMNMDLLEKIETS
jgi:hypothetical protein